MAMRNVISTLNTADGTEIMGPGILMWHYPSADIMNGSLLTVESNHFCVLKSRGAILNVYETGQYPVETPQRPLLGNFQQAFYGGQSPWQYEALFISRAKSVVKAQGVALSRELAEMVYDVDYYVHIDTKEDAVKLVTHMPYQGHVLTTDALNAYAGPVVEQAINQLVQVTPLEQVNEKIHDITELVRGHLQDFLVHLRSDPERRQGTDAAARRKDARAHFPPRLRSFRTRRRPLLRGAENGRAWPGVGPQHGRWRVVQHRHYRGAGWHGSGRSRPQ